MKTLASLLAYPVRSASSVPPSLKQHIAYTFVRNFAGDFTPGQHQYAAAGTDAAYEAFCKNHSLSPDNEILSDGTRALWIGPRDAKKVMIHLHGGGYVLPAAGYVFEYLYTMREDLKKNLPESQCGPDSNSVLPSILILSYDLSPGAQFPRQLIQANMLLNHMLTVRKYAPKDLILSGDSAGANLALALLSHIVHPHQAVPQSDFPLQEKFLGVILISPWAHFDYSTPAFTTNAIKDDISIPFLENCSKAFLGTAYPHPQDKDTPYTQPAFAPSEWWKDIPVDQILITGGEDEVLVDGIRDLRRHLVEGLGASSDGISGSKHIELVIAKGEAHESPMLDTALGIQTGESAKRIEGWVRSKL